MNETPETINVIRKMMAIIIDKKNEIGSEEPLDSETIKMERFVKHPIYPETSSTRSKTTVILSSPPPSQAI